MCLGVPGRIVSVAGDGGPPMGRVDFEGVTRDVCLAYVPGARVGDYVIVHVGFALTVLDEAEARATLDLLRQLDRLDRPEEAVP